MSESASSIPEHDQSAHEKRDNSKRVDRIRTVLICQEEAEIDRRGIASWLGSFSDLAGVVVIRERKQRMWRRIRREIKRVGVFRFPDVLAFRLYYKLFFSQDRLWEKAQSEEMVRSYITLKDTPELLTHSPNSPEAEQFIRAAKADIVIARCKTLLKESIFTLPVHGTFVMHPGICPEYRNAHGCFWALANGDLEKVGMTLLKIDRGVDTGPVYGYYSYAFDEINESPARIQHRCVLENLDAVAQRLVAVCGNEAEPMDTKGRASATWGQPWLTSYLKLRRRARRRLIHHPPDTASARTSEVPKG